jgi:2-C-methyl-D-erythritol 4-phosphate cytidylyltransferase
MNAVALLLGAGRGSRLGGDRPKAFLPLAGRPLLAHAVAAIEACDRVSGFIVVAPEGREDEARDLASSKKLLDVVPGGETRQASARRGFQFVPAGFDAVLCHDVARPLATPWLFVRVLEGLSSADAVVPAVPVADTVKRVHEGRVVETLDRDGLMLAQTPQGFRREALERAYRDADQASGEGTDDAVLVERAGLRVVVVPGDASNIKITGPADLLVAEALLGGLDHG